MKRRTLLAQGAAAAGAARWPAAAAAPASGAARGIKRLRVAFNSAEVGFDPLQVSDQTSNTVNAHIFETLLSYDALARPAQLRPLTAAAMPEVSADFRHFVFTLQPGIYFSDDPAFKGRRRELVAADYVYSIKRYYDPQLRTEHLYQFENAKLLGLSELRRRVQKSKQPFPYDEPVEGLRTLDRYRFEVRLAEPDPRFVHVFAAISWSAALAREVVEAYGADLMAHPVGTGPFVLKDWRRGSRILLARNPGFREQIFDSVAPADEPLLQAMAAHLAGKRLPLVDEVEVSIIEEAQPRWLAFLGGQLDHLELPFEYASIALPNGQLAPYLAARGVRARTWLAPVVKHTFFNFDDPQVGGYTPDKVALRRAVALAYDGTAEARQVFQGRAIPAQSLFVPHTYGYDPQFRSELGQASTARANALLDLFGYTDSDGDGYRDNPDGSPLVLRMAAVATQRQRAINELWKKQMDAIGLRIAFESGTFGELIKRALAGKLMMWGFSWSAGTPDADFYLGMGYGPNADQSNDARFKLAAFDRLYERQRVLPDGPERFALMRQANKMLLAYMPYIPHLHTVLTDLLQPRVRSFVRHPFARDWWRFADVAEAPDR
jgi:ABC-type transport system substrate-binding protein